MLVNLLKSDFSDSEFCMLLHLFLWQFNRHARFRGFIILVLLWFIIFVLYTIYFICCTYLHESYFHCLGEIFLMENICNFFFTFILIFTVFWMKIICLCLHSIFRYDQTFYLKAFQNHYFDSMHNSFSLMKHILWHKFK